MADASNKVYTNIFDAIHNLRTVKHAKPTAEKIFNYLKKNNEQLDLTMFKFNLEKLVKEKYLEKREKVTTNHTSLRNLR